MLLVLTRGTPLYSLLLPASTLSLLPLLSTLWSRGNAFSTHSRHSLCPHFYPSLPSLRSLYSIYDYGVGGVLLYPYLGRIGSGQQVGILGITPLVTHIDYPPPTPLMGATLGGCR